MASALFWPILAGTGLLISTVSTGVALFEVIHLEGRFDRRAEDQMRQLAERMNDAIAESQEQARSRDDRLSKRINELVLKLDPNSSPLGAAVQKMQADLTRVLTVPKQTPPPTTVQDLAPTPRHNKPS